MRRLFCAVGAAAVLALSAPAAQESKSFGLGVLRRDGALVPFGSYTGRNWTSDWPGGDDGLVLPITLQDIPRRWWGSASAGHTWTAWFADGTTKQLTLQRPTHLRVFCGGKIAVKTDYQGGGFDPREPTVPKDALVVTGGVKVLPITSVSLYSADAKKIVDAITEDFNKEEDLAIKSFTNWWHPFGPGSRSSRPIELEAFHRARESTPSGEWVTNYIEAVRKYPALPVDKECGLITFVRGWVFEREGKPPVINIGARVTYCDRADASFFQPLGRILIDREPYWVHQMSSWRDEIYTVTRVRPEEAQAVLAVAGGGCPKNALPPGGRGRGRGGGAANGRGGGG